MAAAWIPSPNFHLGRRRPLAFIVWHSTESSEVTGAAINVAAGWFAKRSSKVSAHIVADATQVVECVKPGNTAWHCGNANADGYGVEIVGRAAQSGADWTDTYSLAAIRQACTWIRSVPELAAIPARWLTDDQVRRRERGHVTHAQVARVLGGSTHTDPGPHFPFDYVLQQLGVAPGADTPAPPRAVRTLRQGSEGAAVRGLQLWLNAHDWTPDLPLLAPDGVFGPRTAAVVRGAQAQCGVGVDGIVGPNTTAAFVARGWRP